jgi:hypothetical protein
MAQPPPFPDKQDHRTTVEGPHRERAPGHAVKSTDGLVTLVACMAASAALFVGIYFRAAAHHRDQAKPAKPINKLMADEDGGKFHCRWCADREASTFKRAGDLLEHEFTAHPGSPGRPS